MANPGLFFDNFQSFQTNNTIFTTNICEKCPSSIWCRDSNPRPSERESLPITTRPGLPPTFCVSLINEPLFTLCLSLNSFFTFLVDVNLFHDGKLEETGSPGLLVMGGNLCSQGYGFKSRYHIMDGPFFTFICLQKRDERRSCLKRYK